MFVNPSTEEIAHLLRAAHAIAIVGLSADRTRASHGVARALQRFGYRIIPSTRVRRPSWARPRCRGPTSSPRCSALR
jgi:predicted CoA-binding protein